MNPGVIYHMKNYLVSGGWGITYSTNSCLRAETVGAKYDFFVRFDPVNLYYDFRVCSSEYEYGMSISSQMVRSAGNFPNLVAHITQKLLLGLKNKAPIYDEYGRMVRVNIDNPKKKFRMIRMEG